MNMSRAVSQLKLQLGLHHVTLPFIDEVTKDPIPVENTIKTVLETVTIPIYSQFKPWIREATINLNRLKLLDRRNSIYLLPESLTTTEVMSVYDVYLPINNNYGMYGDVNPTLTSGRSAQSVITTQAYMMVTGEMRAEPTFDYLGENKIRLFGYPRTEVVFRVACVHEPNGETIPETCYDSFMQLAKLDVQEFLYNNLKLYDNIASAFGNVQLKIEDHQGAAAERTALLDRWTDSFHVDMDWISWM